ncbi:MAG: T9SS type A sorting domain-containing protein, partial [Bacteroidales bacterium]|nr:T9SS type A sorting domain-containing protein [Bacteroidales bacterium]
GQQVCTQTLTAEKTSVRTDNLPRGVYFILIENDTHKIAEKIILK